MKNLIFLIILGVAGYFVYQHLVVSWLTSDAPAERTSSDYLVNIPEQCQDEGESLDDAFLRNMKGELKKVELNAYASNFRKCLKGAGFTDSQRKEAYERIRNGR